MIKQIIEKNEKVSINTKEIEFVKNKFPSCFDINGDFDIEKFKEILKDKINITNEGYELKFLGKNYARLLASLDTTTVIEPDITHNEKDENKNSENIYISGDNLDGLKHLLNSYSQKIKVIYIDPPYNTGSDGFIYNDNYNFNANDLMEKLNISEDEANKILKFTKKGTASHSAWLTFIYPRLLLARDLLSDDGVIFISIDDNEQANLKLMCDEIFGEENCLGVFSVKSAPNGRDYGHIAKQHEYIIMYAKNNLYTETNFIIDKNKKFRYEDDISPFNVHPLYNSNEAFDNENRPNLFYPFYLYVDEKVKNIKLINNKNEKFDEINDNNENEEDEDILEFYEIGFENRESAIKIEPPLSEKNQVQFVWRWGKEKALANLNKEIIGYKNKKGEYKIVQKMRHGEKLIRSILEEKEYTTRRGTKDIEEIMGVKVFDFPKPIELVKALLTAGKSDEKFVMDFFSGSGTTGHAMYNLNVELKKEGCQGIKYILVQLPENLDEKYQNAKGEAKTTLKNAIELCDKCNYPHTLDYIGIERLKRVAKKIKEECPDKELDLGFKHFILKEVNEDTFDKIEEFKIDDTRLISISNLIDDFGKDVVLTTWLNKDGYGLTNKNEPMYETIKFADYEAYYRDKYLYIVNKNISDDAIKAMVEKYELDGSFNPENIVIFGYSLGFVEMENLKNNLVRVKDSAKNLNINFDIRY